MCGGAHASTRTCRPTSKQGAVDVEPRPLRQGEQQLVAALRWTCRRLGRGGGTAVATAGTPPVWAPPIPQHPARAPARAPAPPPPGRSPPARPSVAPAAALLPVHCDGRHGGRSRAPLEHGAGTLVLPPPVGALALVRTVGDTVAGGAAEHGVGNPAPTTAFGGA